MALATLEQCKQYLQITGTGDDDFINRLITAAEASIEFFCGRVFAQATYTNQAYNGTGTPMMVLAQGPVAAVSAVSINGVAVQQAPGPGQPGFTFDTQNLYLNGQPFPRGFQNVLVTYQAGYSTIPGDITQACIELVGLKFRNRQSMGKISDSVGGEPVSFLTSEYPDSVLKTLTRYRRAPRPS